MAAPKSASADITSDKVEFFGYGRMGIGWTKAGQVGGGQYMNLNTRAALGGRLEEGDYLEPGMRYHLYKAGDNKDTDTQVDLVTSVEMYTTGGGAILSSLANDSGALKIFPEQAYIQAKNVFVPGLEIWLGSRLYRKNDIHIADYFYFNRLNGQGVGAIYKMPRIGHEIDVAILQQTGNSNFFRADAGMVPLPNAPVLGWRPRTMFVAQYKIPFGANTSFVQALGEFHVVPRNQRDVEQSDRAVNPPDWGAVGGLKLHLDFGGDNFNDTSIRYGNRIANGAESAGATYNTFGVTDADGKMSGAYGVEFVEHFMFKIQQLVALNGYFVAHYSQGTSKPEASLVDRGPNARADYAFGVRPTIFLHDKFHLITEATYQMRKDDGMPMGTAVKFAIAPTIVPGGTAERTAWARPHLRLIYQTGWYNKAAQNQLMSPYLKSHGAVTFAHYVGFRAEWWF